MRIVAKETVDNINILISECTRREGGRAKGCLIESENPKTNRAAIVTNTAGQNSSNSTLLGGTAGTGPARKSALHNNKAFYPRFTRVTLNVTVTHPRTRVRGRSAPDHMYHVAKRPHIPPVNERYITGKQEWKCDIMPLHL